MNYRILSLVMFAAFALGMAATCVAGTDPVDGVYVYGPPTVGHSTSVYHYPKSWHGPRYTYPQTYYFKFPPGRRPVKIRANGVFIDPLFFHGATTDAEIWAVRRKGEMADLPTAARFPLPASKRLAPTVGPLPARPLSPARSEGIKRLGW
jgi:hypothetical protein